jgi:hypothetical protein|tara:strand:- start:58 stop:207 length:150 start_codon:yes stop_codon:yes gene_type:complete
MEKADGWRKKEFFPFLYFPLIFLCPGVFVAKKNLIKKEAFFRAILDDRQ